MAEKVKEANRKEEGKKEEKEERGPDKDEKVKGCFSKMGCQCNTILCEAKDSNNAGLVKCVEVCLLKKEMFC